MNFKKHIASVVLIITLFALGGSELFHHHSDSSRLNDNNCAVCTLVKTLHSTLAPALDHSNILFESFQPYTESIASHYSFFTSAHHSGRAPPSASHI
ncbi:MAG TPA: hypothetical protein VGK25_13720 [Ignavibacteria bacterium]